MSAEIVSLNAGPLGDGAELSVDQVLEANKGEFVKIALVGEREDGTLAVAGTHGAAETLLLLQWGSHFLVSNRVNR